MARATSYEYEGNIATCALEEGAWTDDNDYKKGGYFATPLARGDYVEIGSADMRVKAVATAANAIGVLVGNPQGANAANSRYAAVEFFGDRIMEISMHTSSGAVALGGSVQPSTSGKWMADATGNDTFALQANTSGSGETIAVLFGRWAF